MTWAIIAEIIAKEGIPLAQQILQAHEAGTPVTSANFAELVKLAQYRSSDALAAQGIKIVDRKVVQA